MAETSCDHSMTPATATVFPRLLLVDDDLDQHELMSELLRAHFPRCALSFAENGAAALAYDPKNFDAAIVDLQLPDCTGLDVLKRLRERRDLPVIIVTGDRSGTHVAEGIRGGAIDFVVKHGDYLRVLPLVLEKALAMTEIKRANRRLEEQLRERNAELEQLNEELRRMASIDALTGLFNRRRFSEMLGQLYSEAVRYNTDLTCMMLDVDNLKKVNDTRGHPTGDRLLRLAASVIRATIRESDVAGRYGGDEFVVLMPRTTPAEARASAKRILSRFRTERPARLPEAAGASLSIGLSSREQNQPPTAEALIRLADEALYLAKAGGKDRIMVVRPVAV